METIRFALGDKDPVEVTLTLANIVAWERRFKRKASDLIAQRGIEDVAFLAYEAAKTSKIPVPAVFDDFVNKLRILEVVADEPVLPTDGAPTDDN
jgi:hypothetical protein